VEGFFQGFSWSRVGAAEAETADGKAGAAEDGVGFEVHQVFLLVMNFKSGYRSK
jgi:hypothetical protein